MTAPEPRLDAAAALERLLAGNDRWVDGTVEHPHQSRSRRADLAAGQVPFASVLSCADSRVPPELVFDCGLGDLFVIRTPAQVADDLVLGSLEFGASQLGIPLILVLGHASCGAIRAAIDAIEGDERPGGHVASIVSALEPAYESAAEQPSPLADAMVRAQTTLTVQTLESDSPLRDRIAAGQLTVAGGHYDLESGRVEILA